MSKLQWTMLILSGIIFVLSVNVWAAKRDHKLLQIYTQSYPTNLQWTKTKFTPKLITFQRKFIKIGYTWEQRNPIIKNVINRIAH